MSKRNHPYTHLEGTPVWQAIEHAVTDLVQNRDLVVTTEDDLVVGYICNALGASSAYVLQHVRITADGTEEVKFIGVYSSRHAAEAAVARLSRQAGFAETPAGFHIDAYELNKDHWTEGYGTV